MSCLSYVISLSEPTKVIHRLHQVGLKNVEWIEGINGKKLKQSDVDKVCRNNTIFSLLAPRGVLGCALAHIKAWQQFLATDEETVIIFEDDVIVGDYFGEEYLEAMTTLPQEVKDDFDLLALGYFGKWKYKIINVVTDLIFRPWFSDSTPTARKLNRYWEIPNQFLGLHAYILSRKGAQKLLNEIEYKIEGHVDQKVGDLFLRGKIKLYCLTKRIAFQTSTDMVNSSLNSPSKHPFLIQSLTDFEIDTKIKLSYVLSCVFLAIGSFNINLYTVLFLIVGILLAFWSPNIFVVVCIYLSLSFPDFIELISSSSSFDTGIFFHLIVLLLPILICSLIRSI